MHYSLTDVDKLSNVIVISCIFPRLIIFTNWRDCNNWLTDTTMRTTISACFPESMPQMMWIFCVETCDAHRPLQYVGFSFRNLLKSYANTVKQLTLFCSNMASNPIHTTSCSSIGTDSTSDSANTANSTIDSNTCSNTDNICSISLGSGNGKSRIDCK